MFAHFSNKYERKFLNTSFRSLFPINITTHVSASQSVDRYSNDAILNQVSRYIAERIILAHMKQEKFKVSLFLIIVLRLAENSAVCEVSLHVY